MVKIEIPLDDALKRLDFIFKNETLSTQCINDHEGFSLLGNSFGPFEKGKKYRMKNFSAIPFIESGVLVVSQSEKYDNVDIQRFAIRERDSQKLIQQDKDNFLIKSKEFRSLMEKDVENKKKPKIDLDRYNSYTTNIIDSRLLKLLKLAKTELSLDDETRLTKSEQLLFNKIYNVIRKWRTFFLTFE